MRKLNKKEKKAFKKLTGCKFPKDFQKGDSVSDKEQYVYFIKVKTNKIKVNIYHRMGVDRNYAINKKGKTKEVMS